METAKRRPRSLPWLALLLAVLLLTACGDNDTGSATAGGADGEQAVVSVDETDEHGTVSDGRCSGTTLEFENLQTGVTGTATTALAARDGDGPQHIIHVADFALTEDDISSWRPEIPEGQNVITFQFTVFVDENSSDAPPLEVGTSLEGGTQTLDTLTFLVRHFDPENDWNQVIEGDGVGGELTITAGGDPLCFEVDYRDQDKVVSGTVEAPVFRDRMF